MNNKLRLSPTGIDYGDYAWNFASGCGNNVGGKCKGGGFNCWAYPITKRFASRYPNGFRPHIYSEALLSPLYLKKPSRILCAFMGDLFWDCPEFDPSYCGEPRGQFGEDEHGLFTLKGLLFDTIAKCPQHTFLFLTKQPQNLIKFSPFPENCWVGVSITNQKALIEAEKYLPYIQAKVIYLSIEPCLEAIDLTGYGLLSGCNACCNGDRCDNPRHRFRPQCPVCHGTAKGNNVKWVIIGAQTKPTVMPKIEWVNEIAKACIKAGIPMFLKDSLKPLVDKSSDVVDLTQYGSAKLRQEMPK